MRTMKTLILFTLCLMFSLFGTLTAQSQSNGEDTPRVNGYWFNAGNPFSRAGYRGQCTWYVWGRCAEASNGAWQPNYLGNANGWYNGTTNGGSKDLTPEPGAIMCTPDLGQGTGHVSYVVQVISFNSWVVEEYNVSKLKWTRETLTRDPSNAARVKGQLYNWTRLQGFVHPKNLSLAPLLRYSNVRNGDHFYTTNINELGPNGRGDYRRESDMGKVFTSQKAGTVPLFRYYNGGNGQHFYTVQNVDLRSIGYVQEGVTGYVYPAGSAGQLPLYRYYNRRFGGHFYTVLWSELGGGSGDWVYEGIECAVSN